MHFVIGVWVFGEELSNGRLGWFAVVWLALGVYIYDSLTPRRSKEPVVLLG
jgi:EamA domain-containing membrane protein RarD